MDDKTEDMVITMVGDTTTLVKKIADELERHGPRPDVVGVLCLALSNLGEELDIVYEDDNGDMCWSPDPLKQPSLRVIN